MVVFSDPFNLIPSLALDEITFCNSSIIPLFVLLVEKISIPLPILPMALVPSKAMPI